MRSVPEQFSAGVVLAGRYAITRLIARGGMADVFLAHDQRLARDVAVKAFRVGVADPRRFDAETRLLAALSHPNLVSVFDAGEQDGVPFVVLEHVDGPTLATRLADGPLAPPAARRLAEDVAGALDHIHRRRIVHRDVKPSNILLAPDGRALLGDFGVALLLDATRLTMDAAMIGTAAYLAPEQAAGGEVSPATDVYAFGLVLLEALTGAPAYAGGFQELLTAKLTRDPVVPEGLDAPWPALLGAMLAREPADRPSAAAVIDVLHGVDERTVLRTPVVPPTAVMTDDMTVADDGGTLIDSRAGATAAASRPSVPRRTVAVAVAAVAFVLLLALALAAVLGDGGNDSDAPSQAPTSVPPTTAPATETPTTDHQALCAELEREQQAIELEKRQAEETYRDDKDLFGDIKKQLDERKKSVEEQTRAADC